MAVFINIAALVDEFMQAATPIACRVIAERFVAPEERTLVALDASGTQFVKDGIYYRFICDHDGM